MKTPVNLFAVGIRQKRMYANAFSANHADSVLLVHADTDVKAKNEVRRYLKKTNQQDTVEVVNAVPVDTTYVEEAK